MQIDRQCTTHSRQTLCCRWNPMFWSITSKPLKVRLKPDAYTEV